MAHLHELAKSNYLKVLPYFLNITVWKTSFNLLIRLTVTTLLYF
jgi:hypothetical protein